MEFFGSVFVVLNCWHYSGKKTRTENFVFFYGKDYFALVVYIFILFGLVLILVDVNWEMFVYGLVQ